MLKNVKKGLKTALVATCLIGGIVTALPANAQTAPIDELQTESQKLEDILEDVQPVAIGAAVFSFGMMIIKKLVFS